MQKWNAAGLVGVVHLPALPGDPAYSGESLEAILAFAMTDAEALAKGGVNAIILENFGSTPFPKGNLAQPIPPHHTAIMTVIAKAIRDAHPELPLGINCLRNDARAALGIALAVGAQFIRVNVHTGAYVTDQGLIEGDAYETLRYRKLLGAEHIAILADVLVKHATPLAPISAASATKDTLVRGLADAVIVTGSGTGQAVERSVLEEVYEAANGAPILLGSGTMPETLGNYAAFINGAIVGTYLKFDTRVEKPVDVERVKVMATAIKAMCR